MKPLVNAMWVVTCDHFSLVWSFAITIYSMCSTLYLHVSRGAGGGREKNLPSNSGKIDLLKSSLDFSTFSIQKSVSGYSLSMTMSLFVNTTKSQYVLSVTNN